MTEHSPDQEPRLLEGSSADRKTVTLEVVGGTVGSGNVAYATERIEQLCRRAPGSVDCRGHLFALVDDHGRSMAIADAVLVLAGDVAICAGAQATTVRDAIDDLAARLDRRIMTPRATRRTAGPDRSDALLGDDACELDARADAELAVDVAEVGVDRVMGKEEPGRGLAIRQAPGNEVGDASFTLGQAGPPESRPIAIRCRIVGFRRGGAARREARSECRSRCCRH